MGAPGRTTSGRADKPDLRCCRTCCSREKSQSSLEPALGSAGQAPCASRPRGRPLWWPTCAATAARKVGDLVAAAGGRALPCETDVGDAAQVEAMVATTLSDLGRLDVVFSNAALSRPGTAVDLLTESWDLMWQTNVSSLFHTAKHAIPVMAEHGGGSIVATASVSGLFPDTNTVGYATTKAAVFGLVKALAVDHARQRIRVNCLCPGVTATPPMLAALGQGAGPLHDALVESQPIGRLGRPEEFGSRRSVAG